jgi:transcriptional regulator with XRE-family HTH domain
MVTGETLTPDVCRARRRLAGLSLAELAACVGWPVQWIAEYEAGDSEAISKRSRGKLADALEKAGIVNE